MEIFIKNGMFVFDYTGERNNNHCYYVTCEDIIEAKKIYLDHISKQIDKEITGIVRVFYAIKEKLK